MKKIVFTGPECSGKTTISQTVAQRLKVKWIPEYARTYLNQLKKPYEEQDLLEIAKGQVHQESIGQNRGNATLICDTSLLVLKIWSDFKYGHCHPWIEQQLATSKPTLYFLCSPDIPWIADPLREHPDQRMELLSIYKKELNNLKIPYIFLKGEMEERVSEVMKIFSIYQ